MKYYLIKVKWGLSTTGIPPENIVELTQEDIDTMTHDNYYVKSIEKFRKVLE